MVGDAWDSYEKRVLPRTASLVQITETKRAFYAGAMTVFLGLIANISESDDDTVATEDLAVLDGLKAELDEWVATLSIESARSAGLKMD
jgi:hypothetical protein